MKKIGLLTALLLFTAYSLSAQSLNNKINSIGIRISNGAEVSYQRYISSNNRIEANLGLGTYGIDATGIYQWVNHLKMIEGGQFRWYAGAGVNTGAWTNKSTKYDTGFSLGVLGQIGSEFEFKKIPLVISLDYRPTLYISPSTKFNWGNVGLSASYLF